MTRQDLEKAAEEYVQTGHIEPRLTKREYFAIHIMQGMHASRDGGFQSIDYDWFSTHAVKFADALLAKLEETEKTNE
jgi:hypothetical protein